MKANLQIPVEISFTLSADPDESSFHKLQRDIRRESRRALLRGGGSGMSGRQLQLLLEEEAHHIEEAFGRPSVGRDADAESLLRRRFRRAGRHGSAGARRVLQLRQLKTSGLWDVYWARRV